MASAQVSGNRARVPVGERLVGRSLAETRIRQMTGCNVVAVVQRESFDANPDPKKPLPAGGELIVIGDAESEARFFEEFVSA